MHMKSLKGDHDKFIAAAGKGSKEDCVLEVLQDGKLLADFAVFLRDRHMWVQLVDLWRLDVIQSVPSRHLVDCNEEARRIVDALSEAWKTYQEAPDGRGNFEDAQAWADLDMPKSAGGECSGDKHSKNSVNPESQLYNFAVAAMVGIHVCTVCNNLFLRGLAEASKMTQVDAAEEFHNFFPGVPVAECLKRAVRKFHIPKDGTAYSPKTGHVLPGEYLFEEMCPQLFAGIRRLSDVSNEEYFNSMCRTDFEFISFGSNSKSGEVFFFSHDKKFLLKTTTEIEASTLMSMLADYESHLASMPFTFLGRYLGLFRLTMQGSSKLFFVMRSVSNPCAGLKISKSFDIKGSTRHRLAPESDSVGKDLNFDKEVGKLELSPEIARQIVSTHKADCDFLCRYSIMDFSFLVQIHDAEGKLGAKKMTKASNSGPECTDLHPGVKITEGSKQLPRWFNPNDSAFAGLDLTAKVGKMEIDPGEVDIDVQWSPNQGIKSQDGRFTYFFGLIDMLVPFGWYPKSQYVGTYILACFKCSCDAGGASRIPSSKYCNRQVKKVAKVCGLDEEPGPLVERV